MSIIKIIIMNILMISRNEVCSEDFFVQSSLKCTTKAHCTSKEKIELTSEMKNKNKGLFTRNEVHHLTSDQKPETAHQIKLDKKTIEFKMI